MGKLGTCLATGIIFLFFITNSGLLIAGDAILTWDPNADAVAGYKVYYGTASRTYGTPIDVGNQTTYTVTGLIPGTYYFAVTAYNSARTESGFSNEVSKTITSADTTPPVISAVTASSITQSGATISWTTNEPSDTRVDYGTTTSYGNSAPPNTNLVTSHSVTLSGLTPSTLYHYRVGSLDAATNLATSGDFTFSTAADTTPPVISAISASSITLSGATISWTTNEASDTQVDYGTTASYGSSTTVNASQVTAHSSSLSGLTAATLYHYRVKSRDAAGNLATSPDSTFTTAADVTPPSVPAGLSANAASATQINLSWTASTDNVAVTGYRISRNSTQVATTAGTLFQDTGLNPSTSYSYTVSAYDAAGNNSAPSTAAFATTQAPPDTTPPLISSVTAASNTSTDATVTWTTDEPADSQVEYGTTTTYGSSTTLDPGRTTAHSQPLSGLVSGTTYHYRVKSRDAAGNLAVSADFNFATTSRCDVNGDAGINALDLQVVVNAILAGSNPSKLDINGDGRVDVLDLQILNNVILGVRTCPI